MLLKWSLCTLFLFHQCLKWWIVTKSQEHLHILYILARFILNTPLSYRSPFLVFPSLSLSQCSLQIFRSAHSRAGPLHFPTLINSSWEVIITLMFHNRTYQWCSCFLGPHYLKLTCIVFSFLLLRRKSRYLSSCACFHGWCYHCI